MSNDAYIDDLLAALDSVRQERDEALRAFGAAREVAHDYEQAAEMSAVELNKATLQIDTLRAALNTMTAERDEAEKNYSLAVNDDLFNAHAEIRRLRAALQAAEADAQDLRNTLSERP